MRKVEIVAVFEAKPAFAVVNLWVRIDIALDVCGLASVESDVVLLIPSANQPFRLSYVGILYFSDGIASGQIV
ncbi:MAG: hypothetical protein ABF322_08330 [Lentimonas sp.]